MINNINLNKCLLIALLTISFSLAGNNAGAFLENGSGAKSLSLGEAQGASLGEIWGSFYNPASISDINHMVLSGMYQKMLADTTYQAVAIALPINFGTLSVKYYSVGVEDIPVTKLNYDGKPVLSGSNFNAKSSAFILTLANELKFGVDHKIVFGSSLKLIEERIWNNSGLGCGADFGLIYVLGNLQIGLSCINAVAPTLIWDTSSATKETMSKQNNIALNLSNNDKSATLYLSALIPENSDPIYHAGLSYSLFHILEFRAGINNNNPCYGIGIDIAGIQVDYGNQVNLGNQDIDQVSRLSVNFKI